MDSDIHALRRKKAAQLAHIEKELRHACGLLTAAAESVIRHLDNDQSVNSLGELQSIGPNFDRLCALREELRTTLEEIWAYTE